MLPTAPPGRGLTDVQRRRRSIGRALAEAGYVEALSYPFVGTPALDALGLPEDDDAPAGRASCATRCRRRSRRCGRRCCPACSPRWPATSPAGSATSALFEHGAVFPGGGRTPAPLPGVDRRPDDETLAALLGAVPEQPWHVAVALAGDREPRGWWGAGPPGDLGRRGRRPPAWSPPRPGSS